MHLAAKIVFQTEKTACGQAKRPKSLGQPPQEQNQEKEGEEEETKQSQYSIWIILVIMVLIMLLLAFNLKFATDSLEGAYAK